MLNTVSLQGVQLKLPFAILWSSLCEVVRVETLLSGFSLTWPKRSIASRIHFYCLSWLKLDAMIRRSNGSALSSLREVFVLLVRAPFPLLVRWTLAWPRDP